MDIISAKKITFSLHVNYILVFCCLVTNRALLRRSHKSIRTCLAYDVRAAPQNYEQWSNGLVSREGTSDVNVRDRCVELESSFLHEGQIAFSCACDVDVDD